MYPMVRLSNCAHKNWTEKQQRSNRPSDPRSFLNRTMSPQIFLNERKLQPKSSFEFESDNAGMLQKMHIVVDNKTGQTKCFNMFGCIFDFGPMFLWVLCFRVLRIPDTAMHREKEGDINLSNATTRLTGVRHLARALLKGDAVRWFRAKH